MNESARRDGFDDSYLSRMANLATLATDIVAAILHETLPPEVTLELGTVCVRAIRDQHRERPGLRQGAALGATVRHAVPDVYSCAVDFRGSYTGVTPQPPPLCQRI
jgi:hypothetical protein